MTPGFVRTAAIAGLASTALSSAASAAFVGYVVTSANITSDGQNLVRYEVFAVFNGPTDTVLNVFNFTPTASVDVDPYGGFWHKDNVEYGPGVLTQQYGTWSPHFTGNSTTNRPIDSFLTIGGGATATNTSYADPSWNSGGSGGHAGDVRGWNRPDIVNNPTIGWFNGSPPNDQGRVGNSPVGGTPGGTANWQAVPTGGVRVGQFVLSQGHGARTFSLRTAWRNGVGGGVVFSDGTFTVCSPGVIFYRDLDGDGFGSALSGTSSGCFPGAGYVLSNTDCDDSDAAINPNVVWFRDLDGDGFGAVTSGTLTQCTQPTGYVSSNTDCNDASAAINPNTVWYRDVDGDGFGASADGTQTQCAQPTGYVLNNTDNCPTVANPSQQDCNSNGIGDACEFPAGALADCDADGTPDVCEGALRIDLASPLLAPFGNGFPVSYTFTGLPRAYSGTPQLVFEATSDLSSSNEFIGISLDGGAQEFYFVAGGTDCPATPDTETKSFTIPALNTLVADGQLQVSIVASGTVDAAQCAGGGLRVRLRYNGLPTTSDCNGNGLLDSCEIGTGSQQDCNANGKPDSCDIASGMSLDCNANGKPDSCDLAAGTSTDLNGNSVPDECSGEFVVGGSGYATVQAAIAAAPNGATVRVGPGTYAGAIVVSGKRVHIESIAGAGATIFSGAGLTTSILTFSGAGAENSSVRGITFRDGRVGTALAGLRVGGAIAALYVPITVEHCIFIDNAAEHGGALYGITSASVVRNCDFEGNEASVDGGAIEFGLGGSGWIVEDCMFTDNIAGQGGAAHVWSSGGIFRDCDFIGNIAEQLGGGLSWYEPGSDPLLIDGCVFELNGALSGGAIARLAGSGAVDIMGTRMCRNTPDNVFGAIDDLGGNTFSQDCNENGICDADEIAAGTEQDCNGNGVPDTCDLNGRTVGWGDDDLGQTNVPPAYLLGEIRQLAAGCGHSLALRADGTVLAWGANTFGQTNTAGLTGVVAIAAGCDHSIALKSDGTVVCWGANGFGQCIVPAGLNGVVKIAGGGNHSAAVRADGTVVAWGRNASGESTVPAGLSGVVEVACGGAHTVARRADGSVVCWGLNNLGQTVVPANVGALKGVAAGCYHTVGLRVDGTVVAWGSNLFGERTVPVGLTDVVKIAAGTGWHTVALKADGMVRAWGWNDFGQTAIPASIGAVSEIVVGGTHTLARTRGAADCNDNNLLDSCEIASGALSDCDGDGIADSCEIALDPTLDCNGNGVLNSCEIAAGAADCNGNGKPDTCDLASGASTDLNGNGRPDECSGEFVVGGSGFVSISAAISAAPDGATIRVAAGTYGPIDLTGRALVLRSLSGAQNTIIDGGSAARCILLGSDSPGPVEIDGFTVRNGRANNGAGMGITQASPLIRNCIFEANVVTGDGGAVICYGAAPQFIDCDFIDNEALQGGAIAASGIAAGNVPIRLERCELRGNTALGAGGAAFNHGAIDFVDCIVESNDAGSLGGGLFTIGGSPSRLQATRFCLNNPNNTWGPFIDLGGNVLSGDCNGNTVCDADEISAGTEQDCNANGVPDSCELSSGAVPDCNENGIPDSCDIATGTSTDVDSNGIPDDCKPDCDNDGLPDAWELSQGLDLDCNSNATIDRCEIAANPALDCDGDTALDACQIAGNPALDCNGDVVLDSCQIAENPGLDCDANGTLDACDLSEGAGDCDANGRIDSCDIADGAEDKNSNGALDTCELARGDFDLDGIVSASDLAVLLVFWGTVNPPVGDLSGDGIINAVDLARLLTNWGTTP